MLRKLILPAVAALALGAASMPANARGYVSVGIGLPVVVAPPLYPAPIYAAPPAAYYYGPHYYGPRYFGPPIVYGPHFHGWGGHRPYAWR